MTAPRRYGWGVRPPSWRDRCEELAFVISVTIAIVVSVLLLSPFVGGGR